MNKFAEWVQNNDKKQRGIALKIGISTSTLHQILRSGLMPSLRVAYEIEKYTKGAITLYDWLDQNMHETKAPIKNKAATTTNKTK